MDTHPINPLARCKKLKRLTPGTAGDSKLPPDWQFYAQAIVVTRQPLLVCVSDERDILYLRQFQEQTAPRLAGYFQDPIWRESIIQACCLSPHVRNAAIGLAALDRSSQERHGSPEAFKHWELAIVKFLDGIRGMGQSPASHGPLQNPRIFLIFYLLAFCFEAWKGCPTAAISQVHLGWNLVRRWLDAGYFRPDAMDCELAQLFNRLENSTVVSVGTKREISSGFSSSRWMIGIDGDMPSVFDTVEDARVWHEILVKSMLNSVIECHKIRMTNASYSKEHGKSGTAKVDLVSYMTYVRQDLVAKFEHWYDAFKPLLQESEDSPGYAAAIALELRYKASSKPLAGTLGLEESSFDDYHAEFATAIQLASKLVAYEKSHYRESKNIATFTIDGSIVPSLYVVSIKCRNSRIRREAVRLLRDHPRREGLWDSALIARIGKLSIDIEEKGAMSDGSIPECARIMGVRALSNMVDRSGTMTYTQKKTNESSEPVIIERSVDFCW